ncbi:MAG: Hsp70 family protein [Kofleriaceae bacterium]
MTDPIVGIDLGTSNTVVAYADETGGVRVLPDEAGTKIHPSVVSFHPNGGVVVGAAAKQRKVIDPKNTIYSVKRLIGRTYGAPEVQIAKTRMPFQIKEGQNQQPLVVTRGGEFAVPEVSAIVLDHVRNVAAQQLGTPVQRAVVTVPASFNDAQRSATATAGAIAGLTIVRVLNEPTAAALAYGNTRNLNEVIAVYDFGGGTFDITILKLQDQVYEVLGTAGDTFLGGDDLDERLVDRMVEKFLAENRIDLRTNEVSMMRLRAVAEQTKIELSRRSRAVVRIDEIAYGPRGKPLDLQIEIRRDEFVTQCADLIDRTFPVCQEALAYAGLSIDKIDDVILVGGTTKIPYVRDQVAKFFARAPRTDVSPEDAVALGAGLQATSLERILKRKSPSKSMASQQDEFEDGNTTATRETIAPDEFTDAQATRPESEFPGPLPNTQNVEDDSILSLLPPPNQPARPAKRPTAGYEQALKRTQPQTQGPDHDRPAARGQHHDRFEEKTPVPTPSSTQPIARMTRTGLQTPTVPTAPAPKATDKKFPAQQPITQPRGSANTGEHRAVTGETGVSSAAPTAERLATTAPTLAAPPPSPRTTTNSPIAEPPPPRTTTSQPAQPPPPPPSRQTGVSPVVKGTTAPTMSAPPPPPRTQQRPSESPVLSPQAKTMIVEPPQPPPVVSPLPPTLMLDLEPPPSTTARGMGPAATSHGFATAEPPRSAADTAPSMNSPASTAPGFVPPQTFPIQQMRNPTVLDVTPRGLGVATVAGYCEELIRRNSRVPTEIRKLFTTSRDDQDVVRIIVCQGESRRLDSNVVIGDLTLEGLPRRARGETSIEVTFQLDASGILQVKARDAHTGKEQRATLDLVGAMNEQDVDASRQRMQALRR